MIELIFLACLKNMPDRCEERSLAYLPEAGLFACMMQTQPQLAKWAETNPNLRVARWSCRMSEARQVKA